MKIVRFAVGDREDYGILDGETVRAIDGTPYDCPQPPLSDRRYALSEVKLLAPCLPSKIVALGMNYYSHVKEQNLNPPAEPLIFLKPSTSVIGLGDNIVHPDASEQVEYEAELAVVMKTRAYRVPEARALEFVLGYTGCNDVSARDLQKKDRQWTRGKGFDTFCPLGPHIETELKPDNVSVESYLNGERKQSSTTSELIFSVPRLVSFISHVMTLLPGDVIATGTPGGVGPMNPGDKIEVRIGGIGTLWNYVVKPLVPPEMRGFFMR